MDDGDILAFAGLFKEAALKCFGYPLKDPFTETEARFFCNKVFECTGLTVGWKSLKNYSLFVVSDPAGKRENPSVPTLDTLARYVFEVPETTEIERKRKEDHYPYWFRYKEQFLRVGKAAEESGSSVAIPPDPGNEGIENKKIRRKPGFGIGVGVAMAIIIVLLAFLMVYYFTRTKDAVQFTEDFHSVQEDRLAARGWFLKAEDSAYWKRRGEVPGYLTLFTLKGDNWPDPQQTSTIRNFLVRKVPCDCFTIELHLKDFIPRQNWQQAGLLLMEDTAFQGKSIRITLAYNDYYGGYPGGRSILVQAITSLGHNFGKPEEIAHISLFNVDSLDRSPMLARNLENSAIRIEKQGSKFRFLYANGVLENSSFREIANHEFSMNPGFVGLFALKGFVDNSEDMPVRFKFFSLHCDHCAP